MHSGKKYAIRSVEKKYTHLKNSGVMEHKKDNFDKHKNNATRITSLAVSSEAIRTLS